MSIPYYTKDPGFNAFEDGTYYCVLEEMEQEGFYSILPQLLKECGKETGITPELLDVYLALSKHGDSVVIAVFAPHSNMKDDTCKLH